MNKLSSRTAAAMRHCAIACAIASLPAHAQTFPARPVRLVVANAAGGNADLVARMAAEGMSRELTHPVYVDNQAGGRQIPGTQFVARALPDGYTLLAVGLVFTTNAVLYNDLPYDSVKDFAAVGIVGSIPQLIVTAPNFPANNIRELIAMAKAKPDTIHYSSTGVASTGHLGGELLNSMAGIKLVHVPYKATAQANTDAMTGVVELSFAATSSLTSLVRSGKLKALGISSSKRSPQMPDVPAVAETVPGYQLLLWNGIEAPAATPKPVINRLNIALNKGISSPDIKDKLYKAGVDIDPQTPEQTAAYIEADMKRLTKVIREAGIQGER